VFDDADGGRPGRFRRPDHRNRPRGAVIGLVTDNNDPEGQGRLKVRFPWVGDDVTSHWCRIAQPYAGSGRGSFWLPEVGDEVAVVFDRGDMDHPYVLGGLWNGQDAVPPPGNADGQNDYKIWRTRQGHQLEFKDTDGAQRVTLTDGPGERHLVIDVAADTITITADPGDITFEAPAKSVSVNCKTLEIEVSNDSTWRADTTLTESSTDRSETITGADSISVKMGWSLQTKAATISPGKTAASFGRLGAAVSGALTMAGNDKKTVAEEIGRQSAPETATYGSLTVRSSSRAAFAGDGPITITGQSTLLNTKDAVITAGAILTVQGGMMTITGGTGFSALGQLVKLN
jgi:phage baseplate assembly protein gpV